MKANQPVFVLVVLEFTVPCQPGYNPNFSSTMSFILTVFFWKGVLKISLIMQIKNVTKSKLLSRVRSWHNVPQYSVNTKFKNSASLNIKISIPLIMIP